MQTEQLIARAASGAAAGLAATAVLHRVQGVFEQRVPAAAAPIRRDPGEFMVEQAESALPESARERIPEPVEKVAVKALHLGYGTTFGVLYGMLRPRGGNVLADGLALGLVTWAAGFLGWLPATGLLPPPDRQRPAQLLGPILEHAVYGIATVSAWEALRRGLAARGIETA